MDCTFANEYINSTVQHQNNSLTGADAKTTFAHPIANAFNPPYADECTREPLDMPLTQDAVIIALEYSNANVLEFMST